MENIKITYMFDFNTPNKTSYTLEFNPVTMEYIADKGDSSIIWTKLGHNKCEHCPLKETEVEFCPVARNLAQVAAKFTHEKSFRETTVGVVTQERSYMKKVPLQEGLYSIFGLIMSTSGCTHLNFLKTMARFHLPFSTAEETSVRSMSMYLLRQFFKAKKGEKVDFQLTELDRLYTNVNKVNRGIIARIRTITRGKGDAEENAIIALDTYANLLSLQISGDTSDIEKIVLFD